ncbi:MAG: ABC transporter substrate-binding protein [Rhodospirillales bacterium]|nr:ABC transporter substrate-binding protein [Rhodospirillales bacterium]
MLRRRKFLSAGAASLLIVVVAAGGGLPNAARADEYSDGTKIFIKTLAEKAIASLTVKDLSKGEREKRFRTLMLDNFAIPGIARFVLGRHWPRASEQEKSEYLKLFEDLMVATYAERFSKYAGETLEIEQAEVRGENDIIVYSTIKRVDGAQPIKVAWRVRGKPGGFKIVDVIVEGISMVQTQKSEFASFIQQHDGNLGALLTEIRKRIQANT